MSGAHPARPRPIVLVVLDGFGLGRDPAADAIAAALGDRRLTAIVSTHGHDDHIDAAPALRARTGAPVLLHPDDLMLWKRKHPDATPDGELVIE